MGTSRHPISLMLPIRTTARWLAPALAYSAVSCVSVGYEGSDVSVEPMSEGWSRRADAAYSWSAEGIEAQFHVAYQEDEGLYRRLVLRNKSGRRATLSLQPADFSVSSDKIGVYQLFFPGQDAPLDTNEYQLSPTSTIAVEPGDGATLTFDARALYSDIPPSRGSTVSFQVLVTFPTQHAFVIPAAFRVTAVDPTYASVTTR